MGGKLIGIPLWAATVIAIFSGCSSMQTHKEQFVEVDRAFSNREFGSAALKLESAKADYYSAKDRVLFYLDVGMLYHYGEKESKSNESLTLAEDAIDELYTKSISKAVASMLLNDNALDYSGEAYEDVYLNVFKALNYIKMRQFDDAFVEVRRANNKLAQLEDKYRKIADDLSKQDTTGHKFKVGHNRFTNSALANYISFLMYRSQGKCSDAEIDARRIRETWKTESDFYNFPIPPLESCPDNGSPDARLNIVSFVGRSPELFARTLSIYTFKDAIGIYQSDGRTMKQIDVIQWPGMEESYHFKFSLPYMVKKGTLVWKAVFEVDNKEAGSLQMIESLEDAAVETYKLHEGITYLKTIIRAVAKGLANEALNKELDKKTGGGVWGNLTRLTTGALMDATENADLRLSRYFPARALVGEVKVKPGIHSVTVKYYDGNGQLLYVDFKGQIMVSKEGLNLVESSYLN